jgi:DNA-binding response OmpR family regulator
MAYQVITVEDDAPVAELLAFVLQHDAISVFTAHDGVTGLEMIRSIEPDLVLLDVMIPDMDGWQVYDAMRADAALSATPVIMVSVVPEDPERARVFARSDIDTYFAKPFDARLLRGEIERMLGVTLWDMPNLSRVWDATQNTSDDAARPDPVDPENGEAE